MLYPNFTLRPIVLGNNATERVSSYKILVGVFIDRDLKWNSHVDNIYQKTCKKLYSLRIPRRAGVDQGSISKVYISSVRSVLEYQVIYLTKLNPCKKGRLRLFFRVRIATQIPSS